MTGTKPPVIRPPHRTKPSWNPSTHAAGPQTDFELEDHKRVPVPWVSIGLLLGGMAAGIGFSSQNDYLLGQIGATILGLSGLHGLWRGGLRKLIMLPATFVVLFLAMNNPGFADPITRAVFGKPSPFTNGIVCVAVVALALVVIGSVVKLFRNRFIMKRPFLRGADRFFGTSIGVAEGALTMLVLCWATVLLEPQARVIRDHPNRVTESMQHRFAAGIIQLAEEIQDGPFESIVHEANLLERFPEVRDALYNLGEQTQLDLEAIHPDARREPLDAKARKELMDRVKKLDPDLFGTPMDKVEKGHKDRDRAYRRMPMPRRNDH
ncbi:MAG: CvpA family protein [Phycisphaerales bacterium]|nr:CvpA family protein [Phycisphaerales bacterium]